MSHGSSSKVNKNQNLLYFLLLANLLVLQSAAKSERLHKVLLHFLEGQKGGELLEEYVKLVYIEIFLFKFLELKRYLSLSQGDKS